MYQPCLYRKGGITWPLLNSQSVYRTDLPKVEGRTGIFIFRKRCPHQTSMFLPFLNSFKYIHIIFSILAICSLCSIAFYNIVSYRVIPYNAVLYFVTIYFITIYYISLDFIILCPLNSALMNYFCCIYYFVPCYIVLYVSRICCIIS